MRWKVLLASLASVGGIGMSATVVSAAETITYEYDAQGRLVKVVHSGTVNNGEQVVYVLDDADNRTKKTTTGA